MLCVLVSGGDFCLSFAFDVEKVLIGHYVASNPRYSSSTPQALWLVDDSKKINIFVLHVEVLGSESGLFF